MLILNGISPDTLSKYFDSSLVLYIILALIYPPTITLFSSTDFSVTTASPVAVIILSGIILFSFIYILSLTIDSLLYTPSSIPNLEEFLESSKLTLGEYASVTTSMLFLENALTLHAIVISVFTNLASPKSSSSTVISLPFMS